MVLRPDPTARRSCARHRTRPGRSFLVVLALYAALAVAYSAGLKRIMMLDVILIAIFYSLRGIAGYEATQLDYSVWLISFTQFLFISLALMKRDIELATLKETGANGSGRGRRCTMGATPKRLEAARRFSTSCRGFATRRRLRTFCSETRISACSSAPCSSRSSCISFCPGSSPCAGRWALSWSSCSPRSLSGSDLRSSFMCER